MTHNDPKNITDESKDENVNAVNSNFGTVEIADIAIGSVLWGFSEWIKEELPLPSHIIRFIGFLFYIHFFKSYLDKRFQDAGWIGGLAYGCFLAVLGYGIFGGVKIYQKENERLSGLLLPDVGAPPPFPAGGSYSEYPPDTFWLILCNNAQGLPPNKLEYPILRYDGTNLITFARSEFSATLSGYFFSENGSSVELNTNHFNFFKREFPESTRPDAHTLIVKDNDQPETLRVRFDTQNVLSVSGDLNLPDGRKLVISDNGVTMYSTNGIMLRTLSGNFGRGNMGIDLSSTNNSFGLGISN